MEKKTLYVISNIIALSFTSMLLEYECGELQYGLSFTSFVHELTKTTFKKMCARKNTTVKMPLCVHLKTPHCKSPFYNTRYCILIMCVNSKIISLDLNLY